MSRMYCSIAANPPSHLAACLSCLTPCPVNVYENGRYISGFTSETSAPATGDSLDGLLNRSALMDVPFRGMQRQEMLIYLAALDDPSLPDDPDTAVAFQVYPAYDMLDAGFTTYNNEVLRHSVDCFCVGSL